MWDSSAGAKGGHQPGMPHVSPDLPSPLPLTLAGMNRYSWRSRSAVCSPSYACERNGQRLAGRQSSGQRCSVHCATSHPAAILLWLNSSLPT